MPTYPTPKIRLTLPRAHQLLLRKLLSMGLVPDLFVACWTKDKQDIPENVQTLIEVLTRSQVSGAHDWVPSQPFPITDNLRALALTITGELKLTH